MNVNKEFKFKSSSQVDSLANDESDNEKERACDTLIMCIATTLNNGFLKSMSNLKGLKITGTKT